jgi:hypothetical protein
LTSVARMPRPQHTASVFMLTPRCAHAIRHLTSSRWTLNVVRTICCTMMRATGRVTGAMAVRNALRRPEPTGSICSGRRDTSCKDMTRVMTNGALAVNLDPLWALSSASLTSACFSSVASSCSVYTGVVALPGRGNAAPPSHEILEVCNEGVGGG